MHSLLLSDFKQNSNDSTVCEKFCDIATNVIWALDLLPPLNGWTYRAFETDYPQCSDRVCKKYGDVKPVRNKLRTDKKNGIGMAQHFWMCMYKTERNN